MSTKITRRHPYTNRQIMIISSVAAGLILVIFFILVAVSVSSTDAPLQDNVGGNPGFTSTETAATEWNDSDNAAMRADLASRGTVWGTPLVQVLVTPSEYQVNVQWPNGSGTVYAATLAPGISAYTVVESSTELQMTTDNGNATVASDGTITIN